MTARPCLDCGGLIASGSRCTNCQAITDRARGSRQTRGYTAEHEAERKHWAPLVAVGVVACARCGHPIPPGTAWDLGHTDDRTTWTGPEHAFCNRSAAGRHSHRADRW